MKSSSIVASPSSENLDQCFRVPAFFFHKKWHCIVVSFLSHKLKLLQTLSSKNNIKNPKGIYT
jgi:hypothetical protein